MHENVPWGARQYIQTQVVRPGSWCDWSVKRYNKICKMVFLADLNPFELFLALSYLVCVNHPDKTGKGERIESL